MDYLNVCLMEKLIQSIQIKKKYIFSIEKIIGLVNIILQRDWKNLHSMVLHH